MSYLVLARKWRPKNFEEVVGQGHVTQTLRNALLSGRLAHAFLFSGPRGVGKTSVARIVAKAINCHESVERRPCNQCPACEEINRGSSVDVVEIDGASNRGIDEIRQLRENILFRPTSLSSKVYIIDEVHMLTKEAFNALLKTLEEPPGHVYFIFATTEPNKVPATIKSRCQHYEFKRLSIARLAAHLDHILEREGIELEEGVTRVIAREAEGSVRDSLSLLDQIIAYGAVSFEEVCKILGISGPAQVDKLARSLLNRDVKTALHTINEIYQSGADIMKLVSDLTQRMRVMAIVKALGAKGVNGLTELDPQEAQQMEEMLQGVHLNQLLLFLNELIKSHAMLARSEVPRLYLELLFMKLCAMGEVVEIDDVIGLLKGYEGEASHTPPPISTSLRPEHDGEAAEPVSESRGSQGQGEKKGDWNGFIEYVENRTPVLSSLLEDCLCSELDLQGRRCKIVCGNGYCRDQLNDPEKRRQLATFSREFFGEELDFRFELQDRDGVDTAKTPDKKGQDHSRSTVNARLVELPLVQEAMRVFGANIKEIRAVEKRKE